MATIYVLDLSVAYLKRENRSNVGITLGFFGDPMT